MGVAEWGAIRAAERLLREVKAIRAVIAWHEAQCTCDNCDVDGNELPMAAEYPCQTIRLLGAIFDDRPGYQPSWAPA